jgi:hypothetical protein
VHSPVLCISHSGTCATSQQAWVKQDADQDIPLPSAGHAPARLSQRATRASVLCRLSIEVSEGAAQQLVCTLDAPGTGGCTPHRGVPHIQHRPPCRLHRGGRQRVVGSPVGGAPVPLHEWPRRTSGQDFSWTLYGHMGGALHQHDLADALLHGSAREALMRMK